MNMIDPAIVTIRHQPADQGKRNDRQETDTTYNTDCDRILAQLTDVPEQRPLLHLGPNDRDQSSRPRARANLRCFNAGGI